MTHLRQLMLDELQRRNYSPSTVRCYIHAVTDFSRYFHRSPERLGPSHIREYQVHLFRDRKLSPGTIQSRCAALRFLYVKTLRRPYLLDEIPFPKRPRKLPTVLSPEEVARLIDSARNLMHRTMLMTLYATGLRRTCSVTPRALMVCETRMWRWTTFTPPHHAANAARCGLFLLRRVHFRDECLNVHWFETLAEAKQLIEAWRQEYNDSRSHRALEDRTPSEFASQYAASRVLTET